MKKVVILGSGLVGKEIAKDLASYYDVTAVDCRDDVLSTSFSGYRVSTLRADLSDMATIKKTIAPFDVVVGALPGFMGTQALKTIIEAGKNVVDIAFSPEDPFELDALAQKNKVTAIVDFGVAPGTSNVLLGYHNKKMQRIERFECMVGGLPNVRTWPFEYKAVFSPCDVIEEYTRPARYIENGCEVIRPALTDPELIHFEGVGTLEAFNTDGLRTLAKTISAPHMKEKTLRYPGHARFMEALRTIGFFNKEPMEIAGTRISPLDFTSKLMFPHWKLMPNEEEFTVMRIVIEGINSDGLREVVTYNLLDRFDKKNHVTSMARTTGYACTAAVRLLADGKFTRKGICPPEYIGEQDDCCDFVLNHLKERSIVYQKTVSR